MRTLQQRSDIYKLVRGRLDMGMSCREARLGIEYQGKIFDLDNKTWKRYKQEFNDPTTELVTATKGPMHDGTATQTILKKSKKQEDNGKLTDKKKKIRFLVGLSPHRLSQLRDTAAKKDKPYTSLAVEYIIEGLNRE